VLVYGDAERAETASAVAAEIARRLGRWTQLPPGIERHATLVSAFIRAGELAQGLLDQAWQRNKSDDWSAEAEASSALLLTLAQLVGRSWAGEGGLKLAVGAQDLLARLGRPVAIRTKQGEGYAFYALYPESYLLAAQQSGLRPETVVIGIRSIGTGLGAMVAAGLGAASFITVRPHGHPFDRRITLSPALAGKILANPQASFAIVDEGPGLSGSSFGGVADWLEAAGIESERIHFFPSHAGDLGPQAKPEHRERWARAGRHSVSFESAVLNPDCLAGGLQGWVEGLVGRLQQPMRDISGGAWRGVGASARGNWPAADTALEKRKFLAVSASGSWLVKWAGLGAMANGKLARAQQLAEAQWTPQVAGTHHGFLVQAWAAGTSLVQAQVDRSWLVEKLGQYLGFRASALRAEVAGGATMPELFQMARYNIGLVLGDAGGEKVGALLGDPERLAGQVEPVHTDNRLHRWEWLVTPEGHLFKTDAVDHDAAHDLVGCQDIAWDLAGAVVEFGLTASESTQLLDTVEDVTGRSTGTELLRAMELCYLGFQIGLWTFAANSNGGADKEAARGEVQRYVVAAAARLRSPG
jgi:hypothetical protein